MKRVVSAADANRRFSELLRTVKNGHSVVVTSHGKAVAKLVPVGEHERTAAGARAALFTSVRRRHERCRHASDGTADVGRTVVHPLLAALLAPSDT